MSRIRVSNLLPKVQLRDIKIHFSKPDFGGGTIKQIYYPLFNNSAVILFEESATAETVVTFSHELQGQPLLVKHIPDLQVFLSLDAKVDSLVTDLLQKHENVKDEIEYMAHCKFLKDSDGKIIAICGDWYQLEWAWNKIDSFIQEQAPMRNLIAKQKALQIAKANSDMHESSQSEPVQCSPSLIKQGSLPALNMDLKHETEEVQPSLLNNQSTVPLVNIDRETVPQNTSNKTNETASYGATLEPLGMKYIDADPNKGETAQSLLILNDNQSDIKTLDFKYCGLTVSVFTGYITFEETEAIVNAAMGPLIHAGGVAGAIAGAASTDMQHECADYIAKYGFLKTSEVMHTCAGGKISPKVKHIIHTVGPIWSGSVTDSDLCEYQLTYAFLNSMTYGNNKLNVRSLAFPLISSGIFGCPLELCVRSFLNAILLFPQSLASQQQYLREVHLVNFDENSTTMIVLTLRKFIDQGCEMLTKRVELIQSIKLKEDNIQPKPKIRLSDYSSERLNTSSKYVNTKQNMPLARKQTSYTTRSTSTSSRNVSGAESVQSDNSRSLNSETQRAKYVRPLPKPPTDEK